MPHTALSRRRSTNSKEEKSTVTKKTISIPWEMYEASLDRMEELGIASLSGYIQILLKKELRVAEQVDLPINGETPTESRVAGKR